MSDYFAGFISRREAVRRIWEDRGSLASLLDPADIVEFHRNPYAYIAGMRVTYAPALVTL